MLQLVYASIPTETWYGDLRAICEQSACNNIRDEITGVILRESDTFLHVLEGPKASVEDTFLRIIQDPRHHSLQLISRRQLTQREFGYGAMTELISLDDKLAALEKIRTIVTHANVDLQLAINRNLDDLSGFQQISRRKA